jgi:peptidoglycan hydrolase CwlO-like protein
VKKSAAVLALLLVSGSQGAVAESVHHHLRQARTERATALATLRTFKAELARASQELSTAQALVDAATVRLVDAQGQEHDAAVRAALAEDVLIRRVRAAYEEGPATTLDMFFSARSAGDLLSINEFTATAMLSDVRAVQRVQQGKAELARVRRGVRIREAALVRQERQVRSLLDLMHTRVHEAQIVARRAGLRVNALRTAAHRIDVARAREIRRETLLAAGPAAQQQAKLLALLGPDGGRGCAIPGGLRATGQTVSGVASWYGPHFAGGQTASGATFDPSLFTAAHRTLPLGVFLRVRYGERCAVVLVNDRGPYGNYHRVLDLAHAPAQYLGLGVGHVIADVLVPR